jgi:MFS family permease
MYNNIKKLTIMNFFINLFFYAPIIVFFYMSRSLNIFQILSLEAWLVVAIAVSEIPTGILADKFGRKLSIILANTCYLISLIILLVSTSYWMFVLQFVFFGIGLAFSSGCIEAMIYDSLKEEKRQNQMKKIMGTFVFASLIGVAIANIFGSYIAQDLTESAFRTVILLAIIGNIIGLCISLTLGKAGESNSKEKSIKLFKDGLKLIMHNKSLQRIMLLFMFSAPFSYVIQYLYQPYLREANVHIAMFGTIFAIAIILAALASKYVYKIEKKLGMKTAMLIITLLPGLLYLGMSQIFSFGGAILLFIANRAIMGLRAPLFSDYQNQHIPTENRATILSTISLISSIYFIIMKLVIGYLADISLSYAFIFMGAVIIIGSALIQINENHLISS